MKTTLQSYLRENAHHGTPDFPVRFYSCAVPHDFQDQPTHWHEEIELTLVKSGMIRYCIGSHTIDAQTGDLLLIAPDTLHSAHCIASEEAEILSVICHLNLAGLEAGDSCAQRFILPIREGQLSLPPVVHPGDALYDEMLCSFHVLWNCSASDLPYRELRFKSEVLNFLYLLWQKSEQTDSLPVVRSRHPHEDKLKRALSYMQEHYAEAITIATLAEICGFSEVHFMNVFKAVIGSTCIEYLIEYRLALAAIDLQESNSSIMQVALDNGFQNISYFNRTFKKKYHCTPSAYRKMRA